MATDPSLLDKTIDLSLSSETERRLADILDEYLTSIEAGIPVDVDRFVARYPDLEGPLREYLDGLNLLHVGASGFQCAAKLPAQGFGKVGDLALRSLGDYEIVREIGRGGMGIVYEARQLSLDRRVALKVLPFTAVLDSKQVVRFQNEARAAAQLHHPNIVPIHGVGVDRGVHFYAMQYIDGQSLKEVIDQLRGDTADGAQDHLPDIPAVFVTHALSSRGRRPIAYAHAIATLGLQAAEALHNAHECGVIHRDIKPSNLLLDGAGKLWIADFGLARCSSATGLSQSGDVIGTLHYMSPEQARGESTISDPRSDVYALGVTLYELLTLHRAFDGENSATVLALIAAGQYQSPRSSNPAIPIDLENVIIKAMSVAREDRYMSAMEMADDLRRFIDGKPTQARPPSIATRLSRWSRRHRRGILAATLSSCVALLGLVFGMHAASREAAQSRKAWDDLRQAKQIVQQVGSRTAELLAQTPGTEIVRQELLADMLVYHRQFLAQAGELPEMRHDAAATYAEMGQLSERLGQVDQALADYRQAERLLRALVDTEPTDDSHLDDLANCLNCIGDLLRKSGSPDEASHLFQQAIDLQETRASNMPHQVALYVALGSSWNNLGLTQAEEGDSSAALHAYHAARKYLESPLVTGSRDSMAQRTLSSVYDNLSQLLRPTDLSASLSWNAKAVDQLRQVLSEGSKNSTAVADLARTYTNRATVLSDSLDMPAAIKAYNEAIVLQQELTSDEPFVARHRQDLAVTLNNRGLSQTYLLQLDEARHSFLESLKLQQLLAKDFPADLEIANRLGGIHNNLAMVYQKQNDVRQAVESYRKGIQFHKYAFHASPQVLRFRDSLSRNYVNYGHLLRSLEQPAEAIGIARQRRELWPDNPEQLYDVAKEISLACCQVPTSDPRHAEWLGEMAATIEQAKQLGWSPPAEFVTGRLGETSLVGKRGQ